MYRIIFFLNTFQQSAEDTRNVHKFYFTKEYWLHDRTYDIIWRWWHFVSIKSQGKDRWFMQYWRNVQLG